MNNSLQNYDQEKMSKMFPHIAGYKEICLEAAQIIDFCLNKTMYEEKGSHFPHGWLFYGDCGMGKTRIALDIADYLKLPFITISASDAIENKITIQEDIYQGFKEATNLKKCILFIDELDKFAGYHPYNFKVTENLDNRKIFLHELDKIKDYEDVIVIATCNKINLLGDALTRSGRFDRQIYFNYPNASDRKAILGHFLVKAKLDENLDFDEIVKMTDCLSCANIETVVNEAIIHSVSRRCDVLQIEDFAYAVERVTLRDIPKQLEASPLVKKAIAYHEAGHAYMFYKLLKDQMSTVSIGNQGFSNGVVRRGGDDESKAYTKKESESFCMIGLAGYLCCEMMMGEPYEGAQDDIEKTIKRIEQMFQDGFYGFEYCYALDRYCNKNVCAKQAERIYDRQCQLLNQFKEETIALLQEGKNKIEALAMALLEKNSLSVKEVYDIFDRN